MKKAFLPRRAVAAVTACFLAFCLLFTACASSSAGTGGYAADYDSQNEGAASVPAAPGDIYAEEFDAGAPEDAETPAPDGDGAAAPQDGRKIVYTAFLQIESLTFDATREALLKAVNAHGGYISSSTLENHEYSQRTASFTIRIPVEKYHAFLATVGENSNVVYREESSDDVTAQYVDIEARLTSLRAQEQRLRELLATAGDLSDLLEIENQLAEVQYEIERYTALMRSLQSLIAYSTVNVSLYEVREYTEPVAETFFSRLARTFRQSWKDALAVIQDIFLALVYLLPLILFVGAILAVIIILTRKNRRARAQRKAAVPAPAAASPFAVPAPQAPPAPIAPPAPEGTNAPQTPATGKTPKK